MEDNFVKALMASFQGILITNATLYSIFFFKRSFLTHHNFFTFSRAWALRTEVALYGHCSSSGTDWKRLWGSGENSCLSLFCYFIPDPKTLLLLPFQVLGHQTGFRYFHVAIQKLDLNPNPLSILDRYLSAMLQRDESLALERISSSITPAKASLDDLALTLSSSISSTQQHKLELALHTAAMEMLVSNKLEPSQELKCQWLALHGLHYYSLLNICV